MAAECFVPGCRSGDEAVREQYRMENKKPPYIFKAPRHWTMLQIWNCIIPHSGRNFSITDSICGIHFTDDNIKDFHEITLEDGKVMKLERKFAKLNPGAIPTVFPDFPEYSRNVQKIVDEMQKQFPLHIPEMDVKIDDRMENYFKIISECQKTSIPNPEEVELNAENGNECDVDIVNSVKDSNVRTKIINTEVEGKNEPDEITFGVLVRNIKSISKPNSSWSVTAHGKFVMCAKWNKEYLPEKRVVIDRDLNIKVYLNDKEIATYNDCISDISDISNILCILDK